MDSGNLGHLGLDVRTDIMLDGYDDPLCTDATISSFVQAEDSFADNHAPRHSNVSGDHARLDAQLQREASLLMVYLDYGFRQQFPFYQPSLEQGGRAWLLPLLTSTKPVYYATLALGALIWRQRLHDNDSRDLKEVLKQDEDQHFMTAVQELRLYLEQPINSESYLGALACIMQMTIYEVSIYQDRVASIVNEVTCVAGKD